MAFMLDDRIRETSTAPGTGSFTVNGLVQGGRTFASVLTSNADTTWYAATNGTAWETGLLTRTSASVYARTTIFASSNGGAAVNFSTGAVDVFCDLPGSKAKILERLAWSAAAVTPPTNDGTALGTGSLAFSDLFLASGGVLNFNNGTYTITQSGASVAFSGSLSIAGVLTVPNNATHIVGAGGTGTASVNLQLNGGSGNAGGAQINIYENSVQKWVVGSHKANFGGSSSDYIIYTASTGLAFRVGVSDGSLRHPLVGTTASAANAFLDGADSNNMLRSTSSLKYKKDAESLQDKYADAILKLDPIWYRSKAPADNPKWGWYGLGAEDVAKIDPRLVHWIYPDDAYEDVKIAEEIDVPDTDDIEERSTVVDVLDGRAVMREVLTITQRQKSIHLPVYLENGDPTELLHTVLLTKKDKRVRTERRLKADAKMIPDGVQYERLSVLLLSVVKRMKSAR